MNAASTTRMPAIAATCLYRRTRALAARAAVGMLGSALVLAGAACKDSNIPYYTSPTSVANAPPGIQQAVTGVFSFSRNDMGFYVQYMSGFARDEAQFSSGLPFYLTQFTGLAPIPSSADGVWDNEYRDIGEVQSIIATLPNTVPPYSAPQVAAITGILQTMEAVNLMLIAETRDTLGIPVHIAPGTLGAPYCNQDVWRYIVAVLDSGNANLNVAGSIPLPVKLPQGFSSVSAQAAPSTAPGSFAAFNRALAGKAGLELAYAIARSNPGTHPTPGTPGAPDVAALTRADSAIAASALYDPASLAPPKGGGFSEDASGVYWDFSSQSGDAVNPINAQIGLWVTLQTFVADVDTINDLRWKAKFGPSPYPLQLPTYSQVATHDLYMNYPTTSSPIPIIRNEGLVLVRAQIQLALNNLATALTYLNDVRTAAGGLPPVAGGDYVTVRDLLLKEQRISLVFEGSGDRTIALRMYHLEAVADTTWGSQDLHTTVVPVEQAEIAGRNGSYTLACP